MSFRSLSAILLLAAVAAACAPAASTGEPAALAEPTTAAPQPTEAAPAEPTSAEVAAGPATYTFVAGETVARFVVDEVLSGNPKTVIGETDGVTGSITLDLSAPAEAALGPVEVDLTGLETDNGFRNPRPARGDPADRQGREPVRHVHSDPDRRPARDGHTRHGLSAARSPAI